MYKAVYAIAQIDISRENLQRNLDKHIEYTKRAAQMKADIIIFPEMSLTGYERDLARNQSLEMKDSRLDSLKDLAKEYNIFVIAGGPLRIENRLYIASWIFTPEAETKVYVKKYLHRGEEVYFDTRDDYDTIVNVKSKQVSFAICYDIENDEHMEQVIKKNSNLYLASIFYSKNGMQAGLDRLQMLSAKYHIPILMSNCVGICWEIESGGCSSAWTETGEIIATANQETEGLLIVQNVDGKWSGSWEPSI